MSRISWRVGRACCLTWGVKVVTRVSTTSLVDPPRILSWVAPMLLCLTAGCASTSAFTPPWKKADATKIDGPKDSVILTGGGLVREPIDPKTRAELDAAQRLMAD